MAGKEQLTPSEYPNALATHKQVSEDYDIFYETLKHFHIDMCTPMTRVPHMGGKELDLHKLYLQVTNRGGILKVRAPAPHPPALPARTPDAREHARRAPPPTTRPRPGATQVTAPAPNPRGAARTQERGRGR